MRHGPEILGAFKALVPFAGEGEALCELAAAGRMAQPMDLRMICTALGLSQARSSDVEHALEAGSTVGLFEHVSVLTWRAANEVLAECWDCDLTSRARDVLRPFRHPD